MEEKQGKIEEVVADERLIIRELYRDEKKIRIAYAAIGIIFLIIIVGIAYIFNWQTNIQNSLNTAKLVPLSSPDAQIPIPTEAIDPSPQSSPTPIIIIKKISEEAHIKEYFISFGTGSSQASDWEDVPGVQVNIDFGNYQNIKEIRFEVSVSVPTANQMVSIRLFNVTDKHPVWNSEVITTNNNYVVSSPIIYDKGSKTYRVQMKTQLQSLTNLTQARLHIFLQ